jgi:hypothetical protein
MHPREPVVQIGEDDLKLAALFYADCIKEWLTEARVQLFNDFIDPTNAVFVQDEEALQAQCSAIGGACEVRCEICGCDEVVFATEIPATSFLDKQSVQNRFDELLAPSKAFTEALGISYAIDISRQNDSNVIKLRMFLPPVSSRYEPENFSSRERDLARQGSISLEDFKKLIHGDDSEVTAGEEIEPPSPEEDVAPELQITENVELEVDPGVAKALKQEELVKVLSLLKELAGRQPTSLAAEVRLSNHFESLFVGPEAPVFVIHQAITYLGSTLDRYREFVELSRTRAPASDPMEEIKLMLDSTRSTCTSFQGAIDVSKIDLMLQQAPRLPDFVSCVGVRARLFGLSEEMYSEFLRLIHQHKEECGAENLILWEVPLDPLKHKSGEHSCYMLFSGDGIPLTKLVVDCKKSQVSSEPMPATTLRELRDTILVALSRIDTQSPQSRIRRREIDQVMLAMSLDLSDFMINELLVVANSWRGRPIPPSRISKLLNQYILDSKFTLSKDGATIRYLHESELQS